MTNWTSYKVETKKAIDNAGLSDMAYLYYSLLVEGIAVTGSLLPANTSKTWITTKNKFNLSTNHESTYIN